jgi:hypothetical protein
MMWMARIRLDAGHLEIDDDPGDNQTPATK